MTEIFYPYDHLPAEAQAPLRTVLLETRPQTLDWRYTPTRDGIRIAWTRSVHHSADLVAVLLDAAFDPERTLRAWRGRRWTRVLDALCRMDGTEKAVLAALAGTTITWPDDRALWRRRHNAVVRRVIATPALSGLFAPVRRDDGSIASIRPRGFDDAGPVDHLPLLGEDRQRLRTAPLPTRSLAAALVTSYSDALGEEVFKGQGLALKAGAGAVALMALDEGLRGDALRMLAYYGGW